MRQDLVVRAIGPDLYAQYAEVRPVFTVESTLACEPIRQGTGGLSLREVPVDCPYPKYDHDDDPPEWAKKYDLAAWGVFLATRRGRPVGGAAVAPPIAGIVVTEGHQDTAALWDLRVAPPDRRQGVGAALLRSGARWAQERGFAFLNIETQNVNLPACRFYAAQGCELVEIRRFAYASFPEFAHEAMLIWRLRL